MALLPMQLQPKRCEAWKGWFDVDGDYPFDKFQMAHLMACHKVLDTSEALVNQYVDYLNTVKGNSVKVYKWKAWYVIHGVGTTTTGFPLPDADTDPQYSSQTGPTTRDGVPVPAEYLTENSERCPVCELTYLWSCRCSSGDRSCANNHNWHSHRDPVSGSWMACVFPSCKQHGDNFSTNEVLQKKQGLAAEAATESKKEEDCKADGLDQYMTEDASICPVCESEMAGQCKCPTSDRFCAEGHRWHGHYHKVLKRRVACVNPKCDAHKMGFATKDVLLKKRKLAASQGTPKKPLSGPTTRDGMPVPAQYLTEDGRKCPVCEEECISLCCCSSRHRSCENNHNWHSHWDPLSVSCMACVFPQCNRVNPKCDAHKMGFATTDVLKKRKLAASQGTKSKRQRTPKKKKKEEERVPVFNEAGTPIGLNGPCAKCGSVAFLKYCRCAKSGTICESCHVTTLRPFKYADNS